MPLWDLLRVESNERLDLPDLNHLIRAPRSALRTAVQVLLHGRTSQTRILGGFVVTANGPADTEVNVGNGQAIGIEKLPDGTDESGVAFGMESNATLALDLVGQPNGTYGIYVRFVHVPSTAGTRIFWDQDAAAEAASSINTRVGASWTVQFNLASPGTDWYKVADVVWDAGVGVIATPDITLTRRLFFEGDEATAFADEWGAGADRTVNRATAGVYDLQTWVHAIRRQLKDITGSAWYTAPATNLATIAVHIVSAGAHIADTTDPHGALLTQTDLNVTNDVDVANQLTVDTIDDSGAGFVNVLKRLAAAVRVDAPYFRATADTTGTPSAEEVEGVHRNTLVAACGVFASLSLGVPVARGTAYNMTLARTAAGTYAVTFGRSLTTGSFAVSLQIERSSAEEWFAVVDSGLSGVGGFTFETWQNGGVPSDCAGAVHIVVIQGA